MTRVARRFTRQGRARKRELMEHATALFAERGYQQTRVADIVRAAGVAKGLFYWYFDNKEALFRELVGNTRRRLRHEQQVALEGATTLLGQVFAATAASVRFMVEHRELYALMQIEGQTGSRFTDAIRDTTAIHAADTARVLERAREAGLVRSDDDPRTLAYGVAGTVMHWVYFHRTGRLEMSVDELATTVARFVVRAVAASDELAEAAERDATAVAVPGA